MQEDFELKQALNTLEKYVYSTAKAAGMDEARAKTLWKRIAANNGVLRELAYFHDYGNFLGEYKVEGYSIVDIVVWQVDHFKAYMDRPEMNRYHRERLLLESLETLLDMSDDPAPYIEKLKGESGNETRTVNS